MIKTKTKKDENYLFNLIESRNNNNEIDNCIKINITIFIKTLYFCKLINFKFKFYIFIYIIFTLFI